MSYYYPSIIPFLALGCLVLSQNSVSGFSCRPQQHVKDRHERLLERHRQPLTVVVSRARGTCRHPSSLFATDPNTSNGGTNEKNTASKFRAGSLMAATAETGRVPYGEESRKYRRTVFDQNDWIEHRSNERLFVNLKGIFFSGIVRQLQTEISVVTSIALAIVVWNSLVVPGSSMMTATGEQYFPIISLPAVPFTLSSPALGLLLVFRTNTSYGRWSEARTTWGRIITQSRNMVRMASTFTDLSTSEGQQAIDRLAKTTWAFSRSLMNRLSGVEDDEPFENELKRVFGDNDDVDDDNFVSRLMSAPDRPIASLIELSLALDAVPIDEKRRVEIDKSLVLMGDFLGTCERIYTSPVPLVYTRHTARFLGLWMLLLPFALYDTFATHYATTPVIDTTVAPWLQIQGLPMIPAVAFIALFLFGIEELAVQLEEPFTILPMQKFCDDILQAGMGMKDWCIESNVTPNKKQ